MKKSVLILEGVYNSRRSKILSKVERSMKLFEVILFIIPKIKKIERSSQLTVLTYDSEVLKLLQLFGIHADLIIEDFNKYEIEDMFKKSLELFDKLLQDMDCSEVTFLGVNICFVIQEDFVNLFFDRIKKVKLADNIIKDISPTSIYVDNAQSSIGQIFKKVAANKEISCKSVLPLFYSKSKNKIQQHLLHTRFRVPRINGIQVMSCNNNNKQKILAYVPYINFADAVFPVIKKLVEKDLFQEVYFVGEKKNILKNFNCSVEIPLNSKNLKVSNELEKIKQTFLVNFMKDSFREIFLFYNINFWNTIEEDLFYITQKRIKHIIMNLKECHLVLNEIKPNAILVGDERTPHIRTCVLLAKNKKIPVIEIQHGIYSITNPKIPPVSDKICVWGEYSKNNFINCVETNNQIIITGCPKFDSLVQKKRDNHDIIKQKKYRKILFTTQPGFQDIVTLTIEEIILFLTTEENTYLIIKPHPAEKKEQYHKFVKKSPKVILEEPRKNIDDLLFEADVLVTISSSVGINASILGIPIVLINLNKRISPYSSICLEVKDIKGIIPSLVSALDNELMPQRIINERNKFVHEQAYLQDGKASGRVADIILELIQNRGILE